MRVFGGSFRGVWLGGFAVVVAEDEEHALDMLKARLAENPPHAGSTESARIDCEFNAAEPGCAILWDGDY